MEDLIKQIAKAKKTAESGVDFSPRYGAICPWCQNTNLSVYRTLPWEDRTRIRYHRCKHAGCPLCELKITVKSLEEDLSSVAEPAPEGTSLLHCR